MRLDRYLCSNRLVKARSFRSERHLKWVRSRICVATGAKTDIDAHHVQRQSQGLNDYTAIPLTHEAHMRGHAEGWDKIEQSYLFDIKDALIATLVERVAELEEELACTR